MLDVFDGILAARLCGEGSSPTPPEPVLTEKTVTANGTYDASDDGADGYSAVTVSVATETPDDMELYGVINNDHVWNNDSTKLYLILESRAILNRVCLEPNTVVRIPKGCKATLRWDKEGVLINCFNLNADGSQRGFSPYSWSASIEVDRTEEASDFYFSPSGKKSDNSQFSPGEMPTKLIVTYER